MVEDEEAPIAFSVKAMEKCLIIRRRRALSRVAGFQYFHKLSQLQAFLSVQHEILRYLAPALRGDKDEALTDKVRLRVPIVWS